MLYHTSQGGALIYLSCFLENKVKPLFNPLTSTGTSDFEYLGFEVVTVYLLFWGAIYILFGLLELPLIFPSRHQSRLENRLKKDDDFRPGLVARLIFLGIVPMVLSPLSAVYAHTWYKHFEKIPGPDQRSLVLHCRALFVLLIANTPISVFTLVVVPVAVSTGGVSWCLSRLSAMRGGHDRDLLKTVGRETQSREMEPQD